MTIRDGLLMFLAGAFVGAAVVGIGAAELLRELNKAKRCIVRLLLLTERSNADTARRARRVAVDWQPRPARRAKVRPLFGGHTAMPIGIRLPIPVQRPDSEHLGGQA